MLHRKLKKTKGKLKLSQYFQELKNGDRVVIVREQALNPAIPFRIQGASGQVIGKRGAAYVLKVMDGNEEKIHIIKPMHLKKLA